jgi:two-component system nitrate/nitrite response regulator NarP
MAKIGLTILPVRREMLPRAAPHAFGSASDGSEGSGAAAGSMKREIMIVAQSSAAAGSFVEDITRLQALPGAPKVVVLLERAADALDVPMLNVDGAVISSPEVRRFLECIESVAGGRRWIDPDVRWFFTSKPRPNRVSLTVRERQIAEAVVRGLRNKEIAREIGVRECTVKMHLHHMFEKFEVASRIQLALAYSSPADANGKEFQRGGL